MRGDSREVTHPLALAVKLLVTGVACAGSLIARGFVLGGGPAVRGRPLARGRRLALPLPGAAA